MSRTHNIINRLPHFYRSGEDHNHLYRLVGVFAALLDETEEDLLRVMRAHWVNTANNEGSKGLDASVKGDLDKILALYLENLGGTSLLRQTNRRPGEAGLEDDRVYRERMKGLIQVILGGPSTKNGLIQIVSANLGIIGDDPAAQLAREQIRIVEFLPETVSISSPVSLLQRVSVYNPNPDDIEAEIALRVLDISFPLLKPRVVHAATGAYWQYPGTITADSELIFFRNGSGLYRGEPFTAQTGGGGLLFRPGDNEFFLDAAIGSAAGALDETLFDFSLFDQGEEYPVGLFDQSLFDTAVFVPTGPVADIKVSIDQLHPGSFAIAVPWDSPGYTVKFRFKPSLLPRLEALGSIPAPALAKLAALQAQEQNSMAGVLQALAKLDADTLQAVLRVLMEEVEPSADLFGDLAVNPRSQIKYIVNKVKAAGVFAVVTYEKHFVETHELKDQLRLEGQLRENHEDHQMEEFNFDLKSIQQLNPGGLEHALDDNLLLSGVFDFSGFDSLNTFG
jgi:hypothetical protein